MKLDFELHYDEALTTAGILSHIVSDHFSFSDPQNWDERPSHTLLKRLATTAKQYLQKDEANQANHLHYYSIAENVCVYGDEFERRLALADHPTTAFFFPSKVNYPILNHTVLTVTVHPNSR